MYTLNIEVVYNSYRLIDQKPQRKNIRYTEIFSSCTLI